MPAPIDDMQAHVAEQRPHRRAVAVARRIDAEARRARRHPATAAATAKAAAPTRLPARGEPPVLPVHAVGRLEEQVGRDHRGREERGLEEARHLRTIGWPGHGPRRPEEQIGEGEGGA